MGRERGCIYDPNQDEREVAEIRQNYSKLMEEVHRNKSVLITVDSDRLNQLVERANSVQEKGNSLASSCCLMPSCL